MKCPNCNKTMKKTYDFKQRTETEDGWFTRIFYMKVFEYTCDDCNIKYEKDEYDDVYGHWHIPEKLLPTQKQKDFADKISKRLHKDISKLITKHQYWEFINNNKDDYFAAWKEFRDAEYGYDGDLYDFNPEYDMDWF